MSQLPLSLCSLLLTSLASKEDTIVNDQMEEVLGAGTALLQSLSLKI